jgi:hypothetical protein
MNAFDSLSTIVNNNPFNYLYEFIVILANVKVRQSHPHKGRLGRFYQTYILVGINITQETTEKH